MRFDIFVPVFGIKTIKKLHVKVFPLCSCLTLKLELQKSAWHESYVAFFMLSNRIMLTGFEVKENILVNQPISCISSFSVSGQSSRMLCIILTKIGCVCWYDELRYWHFERPLALICPSVPLGWGWSTWCPLIRQIEPALDSSFINWEYVTFEVQLQFMQRRWIFRFTVSLLLPSLLLSIWTSQVS